MPARLPCQLASGLLLAVTPRLHSRSHPPLR
jgi:hypothetical protein